ncbi:UL24 [Suid alphaherpesvirus 1]|nr:UL24 [Suid alphaherpesvirus 1]
MRIPARFRAGIRCHNRFYERLRRDPSAYGESLFGLPRETLKKASLTLAFEVNLGVRRPDCVCVVRLGVGPHLCFVIELKTCRFPRNLNTPSKRGQRHEGLCQLRDSARLLAAAVPPGGEEITLVPLLVFVAQRSMRVLDVTRLPCTQTRGNASAMGATVRGLAEYVAGPRR